VTVFSKVRRWLAEVDGKSREDVAPSSSDWVASCNGCCVPLDGTSCTDVMHSDCSSVGSLFSGRIDHRLLKHLLVMAQSILTPRQKALLVSAIQELRWNQVTLTRLCERLSRELKMSYSTVKWNIKRLATMKLLLGGTETSKGVDARPTTLGCLIASTLVRNGTDLQYSIL
jgi:hypothetical protein